MATPDYIDPNPYAAPTTSAYLETPDSQIFFVHEDCLVVSNGAVLPMRCVRTNKPAMDDERVSLLLEWSPSFRLVISKSKCFLTFYECKSTRRQRNLGLIIFGGVLILLTFISWLPIFLLGFLAFPLLLRGSVRIAHHQDGMFWITGFGEEFLKQCREEFGTKPVDFSTHFRPRSR
jgi:hypothetical protein